MTTSHATPPAPPADHAPGDGTPAASGPPPDAGAQDMAGADAPEPVYSALEDWLIDYFLPMFRRTLGGEFRWCAQWWQHGEAISRLNSLWHAWETLRLQPGTGIGTWYRAYLDHQLPILMGARGPFYQCSETTHREPHEAAAAPAPDGWQALSSYDEDPEPVPGHDDEEHAAAQEPDDDHS